MWCPEPVVVTWARDFCESLASSHAAPRRRRARERLDVLLCAGADVNAVGRSCETALHVLARQIQSSCQESSSSKLRAPRHEIDSEAIDEELRKAWHALVARGADASMLDGEGLTAIERLSRSQCTELLKSQRNSYGCRRYRDSRLRGQDPSLSWLGEDSVRSKPPSGARTPSVSSGSVGSRSSSRFTPSSRLTGRSTAH